MRPSVFTSPQRGFKKISIFAFMQLAAQSHSLPPPLSRPQILFMLLIDLANLTNKLTLTERVKNSNQNFHRSFWILFNSNKTNIWLPPCCPGTEG